MLKPQLHQAKHHPALLTASSILGDGHPVLPLLPVPALRLRRRTAGGGRILASSSTSSEPVVGATSGGKTIPVTAVVTVKETVGGFLSNVGIGRGLDDIADVLGKSILLELVSSELDPKTGLEKATIKAYAHKVSSKDGEVKYEANFKVKEEFGEAGAILVENEHHKEMFLEGITLSGFPYGSVNFTCNSWVQSKSIQSEKRIFFSNKSYLPSETPAGLKNRRSSELEKLRGNGQGERKAHERIYGYDTYNDLGNPDQSTDLLRPVLGGDQFPYPRRCRTGRPRSKKDTASEEKSKGNVYLPRDEAFSEVKGLTFSAKTFRSVLHAVVPSLRSILVDKDKGFPHFSGIDALFDEGIEFPDKKGIYKLTLPRLFKALAEGKDSILQFELPELLERDTFVWFKDDEFARQTLAGLNPMSIELVKEFPLKSKLDPEVYGSPDSLITKELIEAEIKGVCITVEEAIKSKRLFVLDYHDLFLPYVNKVREQANTTFYGSRTLFFLTDHSTLRPLAIELTRPKSATKPQWREVFVPGYNSTSRWLWKLAKAHVLAHDAGYHQLVIHWLRTHCCTEPYIIAANRQLSAMHPIYRLLHPHFRYTMEINALARQQLISAGGIIESSFSPLKYCIEISAVVYGKLWRFDNQSLPADLIRRGMAEEDPTAEHGLKLAIPDYPFANDGLLHWSAINEWVTDYVSHYYTNAAAVAGDSELQSWWWEVKTKGHPDIKDGWPELNTPSDLVNILCTIIWVASGHHAAVNFGQYSYGGYFPNRPTITRTNVPTEDHPQGTEGFDRFLKKPEQALLDTFPSQVQATVVMSILDVLSSHSPDEEYLGSRPEGPWKDEPAVAAAFERFSGRMKEMEGIIDGRNCDWRLKNRAGAGIVPYQLLKPYSKPGVTGMGVPNSISI